MNVVVGVLVIIAGMAIGSVFYNTVKSLIIDLWAWWRR